MPTPTPGRNWCEPDMTSTETTSTPQPSSTCCRMWQGLQGWISGVGKRGAQVTAIDIAENFIANARQVEAHEPLDIAYRVASAVGLPFAEGTFDFATAFMSFMDIPE